MGNEKLKNILSQDVYSAYQNITSTKKELGGGKNKNIIDSTTEYRKLSALIAGNGEVAKNKMTDTDIKQLSTLLANASKWKPAEEDGFGVGDRVEKTETKSESPKQTEEKPVKSDENKTNETNEAPSSTDKKPEQNKKPCEPKAAPKRKEEKPPVTNNTTNNSGVNNSFNNNSGTIIIDNSVHFGDIKKSQSTSPKDKVNEQEQAKKAKKEETIRKNKENYNAAFAEGESVADDLIGPTSQKEKTRAIRNIMKQNENTIVGFMEGFYDNDTVMGVPYGVGDLLDLIDNEGAVLFDAKWTDSERQRAFAHIMTAVLKFANNTGNTENSNYKELNKLLNDVKSGKVIYTETADQYIKELIKAGAFDLNS